MSECIKEQSNSVKDEKGCKAKNKAVVEKGSVHREICKTVARFSRITVKKVVSTGNQSKCPYCDKIVSRGNYCLYSVLSACCLTDLI